MSTGKPIYHSPAIIFTPIHEPSDPGKIKLLHFTVQQRETGFCVKQNSAGDPKCCCTHAYEDICSIKYSTHKDTSKLRKVVS